jgi:hypothetical protein
MHNKIRVREIKKLELFFVNIVIVVATKTTFACFNKTGTKQENKK